MSPSDGFSIILLMNIDTTALRFLVSIMLVVNIDTRKRKEVSLAGWLAGVRQSVTSVIKVLWMEATGY
jgi:hypothetical protein